MSSNFQLAAVLRNAMNDGGAPLFNTGYCRVYSGTQPLTPETALSGNVLLSTLRYGATAFGASASGILTANAITSDTNAAATGVANFARSFKSDGTTPLADHTISNQTVTLTAGAALNAVTLTVGALSLPLFAGMDLWFIDATSGALKKAHVSADAASGATSVSVTALAAAIASASIAVGNMVIGSPNIQQGAIVGATSLTLTLAAQGQ